MRYGVFGRGELVGSLKQQLEKHEERGGSMMAGVRAIFRQFLVALILKRECEMQEEVKQRQDREDRG